MVSGRFRIPEDAALRRFMPHMHLRGKAFRVDLRLPDGSTLTPLELHRWDPDWQLAYELADPLLVPAGTEIECTAWYDNSASNPNGIDPTKDVERGEQIWQEMMGAYVEWTGR
jgi:hypothetical protein